MRPIRLGVVGLGLIWIRVHQPILGTLKEVFDPIALCDSSEQRRTEAVRDFPGATVVADYQSLLQMAEVETVLVLTPLTLNAPMALAAINASKNVIMEKPLARSLAEGQALVNAARAVGRRLFVTEQVAYRSAEEKLAEIIAFGEIGKLLLWERIQHGELDPEQGAMRYASTPWRITPDFPLGPLFDGGVHVIAGLSKIFGLPQTIFAAGRQLRPDYGEYDEVTMTFQYANGSTGFLSHSAYLPPTHNHFYIYGSEGVIVVEPGRIIVRKPEQPDRVIDLPEERAYVTMWQVLAEAYQENREPYYTPEKALADVSILLTVEQSIKTGQSLKLIA